jgi:DNA-binding response OmpR family regulator
MNDKRILIVDDEKDLREAIARDLKKLQLEVVTVPDIGAALEVIHSQQVDLIITDLNMPRGSGLDLIKKLKQDNLEIPFIMWITDIDQTSLIEAFDCGAIAVFPKPFNRKVLHQVIQESLRQASERTQRSAERLPLELETIIRFENSSTIHKTNGINFGRGGMFVARQTTQPVVGAKLSFHVVLARDAYALIFEGTGIVRWVRDELKENLKPGYGIEFLQINKSARGSYFEFLNETKTLAVIP